MKITNVNVFVGRSIYCKLNYNRQLKILNTFFIKFDVMATNSWEIVNYATHVFDLHVSYDEGTLW